MSISITYTTPTTRIVLPDENAKDLRYIMNRDLRMISPIDGKEIDTYRYLNVQEDEIPSHFIYGCDDMGIIICSYLDKDPLSVHWRDVHGDIYAYYRIRDICIALGLGHKRYSRIVILAGKREPTAFLNKLVGEGAHVLYDEFGSSYADIPTNAFLIRRQEKNRDVVRYDGKIPKHASHVVEETRRECIKELTRELVGSVFTKNEQRLMSHIEAKTMMQVFEILSCARLSFPFDESSLNDMLCSLKDDTNKRTQRSPDPSFFQLVHAKISAEELGLHEKDETCKNIRNLICFVSDANRIWERYLKDTPFSFGNEWLFRTFSVSKTIETARTLGIDAAIEAYLAGVPLRDVLA